MTPDEQWKLLYQAEVNCGQEILKYLNHSRYETIADTPKCGVIWDEVLCWNEAPAGSLVKQPCPNYIHGFNDNEYATRYCTPEGDWYFHPELNKTWTNFSSCSKTSSIDLSFHFDGLRLLYTIGYGISLGSLIIAVFIMMCCSRLKSKSNTLHLNLFFAFMLRAALSFLKEALFVNGVGFDKDIKEENGTLMFIEDGWHWECRLLIALFNYSICVSQMWIFTEGLYLHMLIYRTLYTDRKGVKFYIYLGWLSPLLFFLPWVIVKAVNDNTYCWNINTHAGYIWIMHGPLMATVVVNFCFFLDILRVLCTRVRTNQRHVGRTQYRRLAKFILVLIPLFGVMHIVFYVSFPTGFENELDMTQLYIEMAYNSFQGFILALLFCFLNEEVHAELKRMWYRRQSRRSDSIVLTRSFGLSSWKKTSYHTQRTAACDNKTNSLFIDDQCKITNDFRNDDVMTRLKSRAMHILKKDTRVENGGNVTPCNGAVRSGNHLELPSYVSKSDDDDSISPESV
ncbi:hypothetical protein SNE40_022971 [Patella caerulea]|uniref:Uncharacterized protein n=1 Tax=Patella caerulea TaxID=87958 RepID=A0AAN8FXE9_PATCE